MKFSPEQMEELIKAMEDLGATEVVISDSGRIAYFLPGNGFVDAKGNRIENPDSDSSKKL